MPLDRRERVREAAITATCHVIGTLARPLVRAGRWSPPSRILVVRRCCFGDVLLTTPLLAALDAAFPAAHITYATGAWSRAALDGNPHVDRVLTLRGPMQAVTWLALVRRLRSRRFDLAVIPERSPLPQILAAAAGIPRRVGLDSAGRGFALTDRVPVTGVRHETERALDLARALGLDVPSRQPTYCPAQASREKVSQLLDRYGITGPFIAVHPGGGDNPGVTMPTKRWPPERFAAAAAAIAGTHGYQIVVAGGPADEDVARRCVSAMPLPALSLAGWLTWDEHAALAEGARLYLGSDTGATHLAVAVGAPTVVVFGPTDPAMYGPLDGVSEAVWSAECAEAAERGDLTRASSSYRCIDGITVDQVVASAARVIARSEDGWRSRSAR